MTYVCWEPWHQSVEAFVDLPICFGFHPLQLLEVHDTQLYIFGQWSHKPTLLNYKKAPVDKHSFSGSAWIDSYLDAFGLCEG